MANATPDGSRDLEQLESLHAISVEVAALRDLNEIYDRTLAYCLKLTDSAMGFIASSDDGIALHVVAAIGFHPEDPHFVARYSRMPIRRSVFGVVIVDRRAYISNDVEHDPHRVGTPPGHPPVATFLGVPLRVGDRIIGMIGVANRPEGYDHNHERLLSTFANQVAVAIENVRLYAHQQDMISRLSRLQQQLGTAERDQLLALERDRIASGLHDEIAQGIFSIGLELSALLEGDLDPHVYQKIYRIRQLASRTAAGVREVIFALAVDGHTDSELTASIRQLLDAIAGGAGLETELVVKGEPPEGVTRVQGAVRAVVKESLINVVRHAHARSVLVTVSYSSDCLDVTIQDDGVGAPAPFVRGEVQGPHFGLANMRRRIEAVGGVFEMFNGEEGGVVIRFRVPLTAPLTQNR